MAKKVVVEITTEKVHMRIPSDWKDAWNRQASVEGLSLTDWIAARCNDDLPDKVQDGLSAKSRIGRPKKTDSGQDAKGNQ
jgi:hypothetical protein